MASLNLSINGPSIKSSYAAVVNNHFPASASSSTYGHWVLYSVQAPLMNAFQDSSAKESILKVETTGEGELADLVGDFNEGRIQYAFVKVKDPNTGLPKNVLIAWCGGGVPERTKGYFTSHTATVAKVLHGYHVQITARSDSDVDPGIILSKVSDASGAKYTAGGSAPLPTGAASPSVAKKPVFTPTTSFASSSFNPLVAARSRKEENVDGDGWGADAPPVTRTQLEKVESAYRPTKVNLSDLRQNKDDSSHNGSQGREKETGGVVRGGYQPVGKVDIAALRAQAKNDSDDRPTTVKGAYEPVGKVDIAAIRAKAQRPAEPLESTAAMQSLTDRRAAFNQSERLTELPKPKPAKKFGGASAFTGTKPPTPGGLGFVAPSIPAPPPVGVASRTFADQGGKTPAQLWAEKKAGQANCASVGSPPPASPVTAQKSGSEWKSGYAGKSWAPVHTSNFGRGGVETHTTGDTQPSEPEQATSPAGDVSALRNRFKDVVPMNTAAPGPRISSSTQDDHTAPHPPPADSRPSGGFALPGLPSRPAADKQQEGEEEEKEDEEEAEPSSPVRIAMPVPRNAMPSIEPAEQRQPHRPIPVPEELPREEDLPNEEEAQDPRAAATIAAEHSLGHVSDTYAAVTGGRRAKILYDYEKAEDNEIELIEDEYVTNIEMVDDDWWMGTNSAGQSGLFPSNYVEVVDDEDVMPAAEQARVPSAPAPAAAAQPGPEPEQRPPPATWKTATATAQFDYEAAEDNELSFPEGAIITHVEFPDDDWWIGRYNGQTGLFPANYVELDA